MDSFVLDAVCMHGHTCVIPAAACPLVSWVLLQGSFWGVLWDSFRAPLDSFASPLVFLWGSFGASMRLLWGPFWAPLRLPWVSLGL